MYITEANRAAIKAKVVETPHCCIFPWAVQFIIDTVKTLPHGSTILEMGTFVGGTTRLLAQANPNITIHTIDIDKFGDTNLNPDFGLLDDNPMLMLMQNTYGLSGLTVEDIYEIRKMHLEDYPSIISHSGNSRSLQLSQLDLVFIDASHQYEEVLADLRYAWEATKEDGYIFGDDVQYPPLYNALWQFCQEVDTSYTIYSKCFKIQKRTNGNSEVRKQVEPGCFVNFTNAS